MRADYSFAAIRIGGETISGEFIHVDGGVLSDSDHSFSAFYMIAIVDYQAGNLTSVKRALDHLGIRSRITGVPSEIRSAAKVIFPGVGRAGSAVQTLRARGISDALHEVFRRGTPILGICLGTQIILEASEEDNTECLGLIQGGARRFRLSDPLLKIPHMGWNHVRAVRKHPLLAHVNEETQFYFVHSYYPEPRLQEDIVAVTEYGMRFASAIGRKNLFATQFHPEKSGQAGLEVLRAFSRWEGESC